MELKLPLPPPLKTGKGPKKMTPGEFLKDIKSPIELMGGEDKLAENVREAVDRADQSAKQVVDEMGFD